MSKADNNAIADAEKVIERFGGIRPMASKMAVPVTTVQGWKKRNVIPGTRLDDLLKAAKSHDVEIEDLVQRAEIANENEKKEPKSPQTQTRIVPEVRATASSYRAAEEKSAKKSDKKGGGSKPPHPHDADFEEQLLAAEKKAVSQSTFINVLLIAIALGAIVAIMWPKVEKVAQIEMQVEQVQEQQSLIRNVLPDGLEERMGALQEQAKAAQESVGLALEAAQTISNDVLAEDAGTMEERMIRLESHVADLTGGSPQMAALMGHVRKLRESVSGQEQLLQSVAELSALVGGLDGDMEGLDAALDQARGQSEALNQTFENVPQEDLKAAALLLGLSQFRSSLGRDNQSFEQDLALLMKLAGEENVGLKTSLEQLAPHAKDGVLTPDGLSEEFRGLAGDIVVASLKGEDVSVQEKAKARFNQVFQAEQEGEPITGTDTESSVARAQKYLEDGNVEAAMAELQSLEGPAAKAAQPWMDEAQITLLAQQAGQLINQTIDFNIYGGGQPGLSGAKLIQSEETGINILKPGSLSKRKFGQ